MLYVNLIRIIINILAENGETRTLTLLKLVNDYIKNISIREPMVFDIITKKSILELPFYGEKDITIDWGDGYIDNTPTHQYASMDRYRIKIYTNSRVIAEAIHTNNWCDGIVNFISLGRIGVTRLSHLFSYSNFNGIISPNWDTTNIICLCGMFLVAQKFNRKIGENWDTSRVIDMSYMFSNAFNFNQKIGDNWDTSRVIDMSWMFSDALSFNQKIGDNWDTSNVRYMRYMFYNTSILQKKLNINWDTTNVIDVENIFRHDNREYYGIQYG